MVGGWEEGGRGLLHKGPLAAPVQLFREWGPFTSPLYPLPPNPWESACCPGMGARDLVGV